jgi:polar amino acid transport system substrate-binding protein
LSVLAQSDAATPAAATPVVPADISTLPLKKAGQLTIHADQPAYPPFFIDNDPTNGKGFESAIAYAIGERLGFTRDQITWGYTSFNASYAPGPKDFDFYISQVSITDERKRAVDFSDPYYKSPLVVVAKQDSPVLQAKTLAELAKFSYGAQVGTIYYTAITDYIKPEKDTLVFDTTADSLTALDNGQIDAVIQDLESANYITTEQFQGLAIAGQLPENPGQGTGLVFEKGSALVPYVNSALASLIADGTRDKLVKEWLPKPADLPVYS